MSYDIGPEDRMFPVTKAYIEHEMVRGVNVNIKMSKSSEMKM